MARELSLLFSLPKYKKTTQYYKNTTQYYKNTSQSKSFITITVPYKTGMSHHSKNIGIFYQLVVKLMQENQSKFAEIETFFIKIIEISSKQKFGIKSTFCYGTEQFGRLSKS